MRVYDASSFAPSNLAQGVLFPGGILYHSRKDILDKWPSYSRYIPNRRSMFTSRAIAYCISRMNKEVTRHAAPGLSRQRRSTVMIAPPHDALDFAPDAVIILVHFPSIALSSAAGQHLIHNRLVRTTTGGGFWWRFSLKVWCHRWAHYYKEHNVALLFNIIRDNLAV